MYTVSDIIADINRGCAVNNLNENMFQYRIIFYVNEGTIGNKHYMDSVYSDMRRTLEDMIRKYLSLTNNIVIAETTILRDGKCIGLQSRPYSFCLDEYFRQIKGDESGKKRGGTMYGRRVARI